MNWSKQPTLFYIKEIKYRLLYIMISYLTSFFIFFNFSDAFLIFEAYPLTKYLQKKFISLQVLEIFNSLIWLSFLNSLIFIYPLFCYSVSSFLRPSYYNFQDRLVKNCTLWLFFVFCSCKVLFYNNVLPSMFYFFVYLNLNKHFILLLNLDFEANIYFYVVLVNLICSYFCLLGLFILCLSWGLLLLIKPKTFFYTIKKHKNLLLFFTLTLLFVFLSVDFLIQILMFLYIVLLFEVLFFFSCFRLKQFEASLVA